MYRKYRHIVEYLRFLKKYLKTLSDPQFIININIKYPVRESRTGEKIADESKSGRKNKIQSEPWDRRPRPRRVAMNRAASWTCLQPQNTP